MPENLFEKIDQVSEQQEQAKRQAAQDKQDILDAIAKLNAQNAKQTNAASFQPQVAQANAKMSLQNFLRRSQKTYHYFGDEEMFGKEKAKTIGSLLLVLAIGVVTNIFTTIGCGIFSTFTLVEDIWLFLVFRLLCHALHSRRIYDHIDYSCHSYEKFEANADGLYRPVKTKAAYKVIKILALISAVCNIIFLCMNANGAITVWAIIFEILFFASVFFALFMVVGLFCMYNLVYYSGKNEIGSEITLVHDMTANQLFIKEDFEKKFPFAK